MDVSELERQLQIDFKEKSLLNQAFTHSSYVNEHGQEEFSDNERLEFLGDAVLELGVSQYLYSTYQQMPEGELSKLRAAIVREPSLEEFARDLQFGKYLLLGRGEAQTGGRDRPAILADVFEAFLGALYLDQGYEKVIEFLGEHVFPKIKTGAFSHGMDYKSELQELIQQNKDEKVTYEVAEEKGPAHDRQYLVHVFINGAIIGEGLGKSKKEAEQRAAKVALNKLNE
ncbi:ribonuclease III [Oceanobacillus alkalisoli]|uniref:ribonuclease III n=1 Tax=Oceanobacillus alkalisoli TaxID=2925113 RepID=UPI001F11F798|nr:ribonuclease III [Oceanobacillus alkalisoli]MCF3942464.1 ribonuclease III [Oceanobacillus alkalisoli]